MAVAKKGDIIRFPRDGYAHFAIYVGEGMVIHRSGEPDEVFTASVFSASGAKSSKATIRKDKLKDVVGDSKKAEIANYLDKTLNRYSADEVVKRARSKLGEKGYNLLFKNCEHFVTWCRYGLEYSQQVVDKLRSLFDAMTPLPLVIFKETERMFAADSSYAHQ